jgi:BMFP domain-containing protein YqiC
MESNRMKELIESILNILPQNTKEIKDDVKDNLKILLNDYLKKIDVVTREEFDVQKRGSTEDTKKIG